MMRRVFKGICLSFTPFAQAALSRERGVSCFSNHQHLDCWGSIVVELSFFFGERNPAVGESLRSVAKMPEAREGDEVEQVPISLKNVSPAIPKNEAELKELIEDLTWMGCEGLLAKPWSLQSEATLRELLIRERKPMVQIYAARSGKWTVEVWAKVYGFTPRKGEGWASRKDSLYVGKFRGEHDPKDRFHPGNCRN